MRGQACPHVPTDVPGRRTPRRLESSSPGGTTILLSASRFLNTGPHQGEPRPLGKRDAVRAVPDGDLDPWCQEARARSEDDGDVSTGTEVSLTARPRGSE